MSMYNKSASIVWWVRRDLRLGDNAALSAALREADGRVLPLFILDPVFWGREQLAEKRAAFLLDGLRSLDADLRARGSRLLVRSGQPVEVLARIMAESGASAVYAEEDSTPYARRRDAAVGRSLPLRLFRGLTVFHPARILTTGGSPYTVFTPFSRRWRELAAHGLPEPQAAPGQLATPGLLESDPLPELAFESGASFPAGETEAQRRLEAFLAGPIYRYAAQRDRPDLAGTSGLSPYLRFGMLSAGQAAFAAQSAIAAAPDAAGRDSANAWMNELIWREFYQAILFHFPQVRTASFRPAYRDLPWQNDPQDLQAWQEGRTGYPFVDAAMRQLRATGWMHNRARMVVASFLVKDLLVDWRLGEAWFMRHLVDGDLAANNGGWQWSAGTGTDAAPFFRVFNPVSQGRKFDPDGLTIRRWLPELRRVPAEFAHEPWRMPIEVQRSAGCLIGVDYPEPIIDHAWARERALRHYRVQER